MAERYNPLKLLGRALIRMGIIESAEETRSQIAEMKQVRRERERHRHMVSFHLNADFGEAEYLLLITNVDPHPDHPITFTSCECPDRKDGYPISPDSLV